MANLSDLTRKEQVLAVLRSHLNQWVDGSDLATEEVGGSEGLRRVRELHDDGYSIVRRRHPDGARDIFQYKLLTESKGTRYTTSKGLAEIDHEIVPTRGPAPASVRHMGSGNKGRVGDPGAREMEVPRMAWRPFRTGDPPVFGALRHCTSCSGDPRYKKTRECKICEGTGLMTRVAIDD